MTFPIHLVENIRLADLDRRLGLCGGPAGSR
jgi:hypothetical protein